VPSPLNRTNAVYTLWAHPTLRWKEVSTWDHVFTKLEGGADLMTPGLVQWSTDIQKSDVVVVTTPTRVSLAIGIAALDIGHVSKAAGAKGKAVYLVHCHNDELWAMGSKSTPPEGVAQLETAMENSSLNAENVDDTTVEIEVQPDPVSESAVPESQSSTTEPSTAEVDEAFKAAALYGLYQIAATDSQNTLSLPLVSSTMVSNYLNPYLPEPFSRYTFKKTSWKKAASFLKKYMEKEGLVKTKDRSGETVILSVNWNHKLIKEFKPYELGKKEGKTATKIDEQKVTTQIQELYKPSGKVMRTLLEQQSKSYSLKGRR
jgi:translation initiation factor 2D